MTKKTPAIEREDDDQAPLDLHEEAQRLSACGFERTLELRPQDSSGIAARLRGIDAAAAVLALDSSDRVELSAWMRGGLVEAMRLLAWDCYLDLDRIKCEAERRESAG